MVLIGTERDKLKHLFVGSSPVPRTTKKALKLNGSCSQVHNVTYGADRTVQGTKK